MLSVKPSPDEELAFPIGRLGGSVGAHEVGFELDAASTGIRLGGLVD